MSAETQPQIYAAMAKVMSDIGTVGKTGTNKEQHYKFRSIEDVMSAVRVGLTKHGVFYLPTVVSRVPETRQTGGGKPMNVVHLEIRYDFYAADGSSVSSVVWGEGADMADKATNKAMSQALKYNLVQAFSIAAEDMQDADRSAEEAGPEPVPPPSEAKAPENAETDWEWMSHLCDDLLPAATTRAELTGFWSNVAEHVAAGKCAEENAKEIRSMITERAAELGFEKAAA